MAAVDIHPHGIMGAFVHDFRTLIEPNILEGDLRAIGAVILNDCMKFEEVERKLAQCKTGSYAPYRMALTHLKGLALGLREEGSLAQKVIDHIYHSANRQVGELDICLCGDEIYERERLRGEDPKIRDGKVVRE